MDPPRLGLGRLRAPRVVLPGRPLDASLAITTADPITFGSAQIGNWDREHRNLNGQIDEIVILGRPLAPRETGPP